MTSSQNTELKLLKSLFIIEKRYRVDPSDRLMMLPATGFDLLAVSCLLQL